MSTFSSLSSDSISDIVLIEKICDQFETDLRKGCPNSKTDYMKQCSNRVRSVSIKMAESLLLAEWDFRTEQSDPPQVSEYQKGDGLLPAKQVKELFESWRESQGQQKEFAQFQLIEKLGEGRFGTVWKAVDGENNQLVALKIAHPGLIEDQRRFMREAKVASTLNHPGIAKIISTGQSQGRSFIVREYIEGKTLGEHVNQEIVPPDTATNLILELSRAVSYSHTMGCIHRDLKPHNIMIQSDGKLRIIDFGLGRQLAGSSSLVTQPGTVMGTAAYMSPEQAQGKGYQADERSDIYSIGVILFELLTGRRPFEGSFPSALISVIEKQAPNPRRLNSKIPVDLGRICFKCLRKEPESRYATTEDLCDDLKRFLNGEKVHAAPDGPIRQAIRFVKSNRIVSTLSGCLVFTLALFAFNSHLAEQHTKRLLLHESELRAVADKARQRADVLSSRVRREAELASQAMLFLESIFIKFDPLDSFLFGLSEFGDPKATAFEILNTAMIRLEKDLVDQPQLRAWLLDFIAGINSNLGRLDQAQQQLDLANQLRQELLAECPDIDVRLDQAMHEFSLGRLNQFKGSYAKAAECYDQSLQLYQSEQTSDDLRISKVLLQSGWLELERRRPNDARKFFERALYVQERFLDKNHRLRATTRLALMLCDEDQLDPRKLLQNANVEFPSSISQSNALSLAIRSCQATLQKSSGNYELATEYHEEVLAGLEQNGLKESRWYLLASGDYAGTLLEMGDYKKAQSIIVPAIEAGQRIAPNHPQLLNAIRKMAYEMFLAHKFVESQKWYLLAIEDANQKPASMMDTKLSHAEVLIELGEWGKAEHRLTNLEPPTDQIDNFARRFYLLARVYNATGREVEAKQLLKKAKKSLDQDAHDAFHPTILSRFAKIHALAGDAVETERLLRLALEREQGNRPPMHPRTADRLFELAEFLLSTGRIQEGTSRLNESLAIQEKRLPEQDIRILLTRKLLQSADHFEKQIQQ